MVIRDPSGTRRNRLDPVGRGRAGRSLSRTAFATATSSTSSGGGRAHAADHRPGMRVDAAPPMPGVAAPPVTPSHRAGRGARRRRPGSARATECGSLREAAGARRGTDPVRRARARPGARWAVEPAIPCREADPFATDARFFASPAKPRRCKSSCGTGPGSGCGRPGAWTTSSPGVRVPDPRRFPGIRGGTGLPVRRRALGRPAAGPRDGRGHARPAFAGVSRRGPQGVPGRRAFLLAPDSAQCQNRPEDTEHVEAGTPASRRGWRTRPVRTLAAAARQGPHPIRSFARQCCNPMPGISASHHNTAGLAMSRQRRNRHVARRQMRPHRRELLAPRGIFRPQPDNRRALARTRAQRLHRQRKGAIPARGSGGGR